jgi:DNA-directed RNA polymerase specialized sigma24 family protein
MSDLEKEREEIRKQEQEVEDKVMSSPDSGGHLSEEDKRSWGERKRREQWAYDDGMSMDQAANKLSELEESLKKPVKVNKRAINVMPRKEAVACVKYAISLLPSNDRSLLIGHIMLRRVHGHSHEEIAKDNGVHPDMIKLFEREGVQRVNDEIRKSRANKIPILGGLN